MLFIFSTWQSDAHDRATWYILYRALCPAIGSGGFSASFLATVPVGDSEQLVSNSSAQLSGK